MTTTATHTAPQKPYPAPTLAALSRNAIARGVWLAMH
jgi:hypothetical protein